MQRYVGVHQSQNVHPGNVSQVRKTTFSGNKISSQGPSYVSHYTGTNSMNSDEYDDNSDYDYDDEYCADRDNDGRDYYMVNPILYT